MGTEIECQTTTSLRIKHARGTLEIPDPVAFYSSIVELDGAAAKQAEKTGGEDVNYVALASEDIVKALLAAGTDEATAVALTMTERVQIKAAIIDWVECLGKEDGSTRN